MDGVGNTRHNRRGRLASPRFSQEHDVSAFTFSVFFLSDAFKRGETHACRCSVFKRGEILAGRWAVFKLQGNSCRKVKRNRELESVQDSQMERERILSEQRNIHDVLEKKADQAFRGEFEAQTRLSEAQSELDRREWKMRNADIALCETGMQLQFPKDGTKSGKSMD